MDLVEFQDDVANDGAALFNPSHAKLFWTHTPCQGGRG